MTHDDPKLPLLSIDPATQSAMGRVQRREHCRCLAVEGALDLHAEEQPATSGWKRLSALVDDFVERAVPTLEPSAWLEWDEWMGCITLPAAIERMTKVTLVRTYGSHLRRLPPQIGRMTALRELDIYTSYSLHWLPYEVTRCKRLRSSRMSTRALYGNLKTGLPFPRLHGPLPTLTPETCSICDRGFDGATPQVRWTTQAVGTDYVPLLIHSCGTECTKSVPTAPEGFAERPHSGGA